MNRNQILGSDSHQYNHCHDGVADKFLPFTRALHSVNNFLSEIARNAGVGDSHGKRTQQSIAQSDTRPISNTVSKGSHTSSEA